MKEKILNQLRQAHLIVILLMCLTFSLGIFMSMNLLLGLDHVAVRGLIGGSLLFVSLILCIAAVQIPFLQSRLSAHLREVRINLAPELCRQRVTIELLTESLIGEDEIVKYMLALSKVVDIHVLEKPFAYPAVKDSGLVGYGGWIHWVTSGCHVYSYAKEFTKAGKPLLTVDCYTCKPFSTEKAAQFTKEYFKAEEVIFWGN